ncbi:lipoate--protein ligase family protein [Paenibacillus alginolyticus]|uniref:Lipoate--protein ligase family protein n=1 Tax=Paenibacillus alginolyticus TaxID=59839 RepID=A0ABT4GEC1_9BACL|nr:lipoate--protein ligase family protein [Paenibacillus alginolyticus]MCY9670501.1 lipoate--protein ligase family protein [Paenibacillus alginolyticus]MCY9694525.1 lipoate--protein ligase family protein [Paenibacillus alginolyticus]MEC0142686.1 lipoate--protein ligase family protein [Paenibacillus alginolyticus]
MTTLELPASMVLHDRTGETATQPILYAFALEELLCRAIGKAAPPILHIWRHPRAFVMGLRDSRLPNAAEANEWLLSQGYDTAVRNSGGAAVPLDLGVVNVSLLLPKSAGDMEHRKDFDLMVALIRDGMSAMTNQIDQGEVMGSFCPGEFDLSIGGRKFCGIAQRRQMHAISVQAFIIVEGLGEEKASLARSFYERAAGSASPKDYPVVASGSMASLSECLQIEVSAERFTDNLVQMMAAKGVRVQSPRDIPGYPSEEEIQSMMELLKQRYAIKQ